MIKKDSSDEEFWQDIDHPIILFESKAKQPKSFNTVTNKVVSIKSSWKLEKLVENLRLSQQQELKIQTILIRNQTVREVQFNTDDIKKQYEAEVSVILSENMMLKENILNLRKKLNAATENLRNQEEVITLFRSCKAPLEAGKKETNDFSEELKAVKNQLKLSKEICRIYMKNLDENTEKINSLQSQIELLQVQYEEEKKELIDSKIALEKTLKSEIACVQKKFKDYKNDISTEMNLSLVINKKQSHTVSILKEEVKRAQFILQTPRLRQKTTEKYQELLSNDKSLLTDQSKWNKSIMMLPQIRSDKEVFDHTIQPLSNNSSNILAIKGSKKQFSSQF